MPYPLSDDQRNQLYDLRYETCTDDADCVHSDDAYPTNGTNTHYATCPAHPDNAEETMPYTQSEEFDSWAADVSAPPERPVYSDELPRWLTDLRDGIETPPAQQSIARQQRLAAMEHELADCRDFIADADRYAEYMEHLENPCVHPVVPRMMGRHLAEMRSRAVARGRQLHTELAILRRQK
jgi:hypothetical protein